MKAFKNKSENSKLNTVCPKKIQLAVWYRLRNIANSKVILDYQGRIQDFHLGGGRKRLCASTHIIRARNRTHSLQGPGPA